MRDRNPHSRFRGAAAYALFALLCLAPLTASGQKKWQSGFIVDAKPHSAESNSENKGKQWDVSVKVGKKMYVVLFVADPNLPDPSYYINTSRAVLIDGKILKFNDSLGNTHSTTILSSRDASSK